jgi:hypothetical protein
MPHLSKPFWKCSALALCVTTLGIAQLVYAQGNSEEAADVSAVPPGRNFHTESERAALRSKTDSRDSLFLSCLIDRPGQVRRFAIHCDNTRQIDVKVADCCIPGDHWQVKVKSWDFKPNTAVATAPGSVDVFSAPARVFSYSSGRDLRALVECSYLHGVNNFPAEANIVVETHGSDCTAIDVGTTEEIDRSP